MSSSEFHWRIANAMQDSSVCPSFLVDKQRRTKLGQITLVSSSSCTWLFLQLYKTKLQHEFVSFLLSFRHSISFGLSSFSSLLSFQLPMNPLFKTILNWILISLPVPYGITNFCIHLASPLMHPTLPHPSVRH